MTTNTTVDILLNKFYTTDDQQYADQADAIMIADNLMFDYICAHARYHDKNDIYWLTTTGIDNFEAKCTATRWPGIEQQATAVLLTYNITVKQLHDADELLLNDADYDMYYAD